VEGGAFWKFSHLKKRFLPTVVSKNSDVITCFQLNGDASFVSPRGEGWISIRMYVLHIPVFCGRHDPRCAPEPS
jgi:hypothetical protein